MRSMPRRLISAANESSEWGPVVVRVGSPPPTTWRSPDKTPSRNVPVVRIAVRKVNSGGSSRWTPAAVQSFWFEAGIRSRSGERVRISPNPSTQTETPKSAPVMRGSLALAAIAFAQLAAGARSIASGCSAPQTDAHGTGGDNGAIVVIGDAVDEPVDPVDNSPGESTAREAVGAAGAASLACSPHAAATSASASSTRNRPTIVRKWY
jgi:hypothetical protein